MRAVVVYESTYGNTRHVAEAIAEGLGDSATVDVVPVSSAGEVNFSNLDLLVVGAPTHVHDDAQGTGDGTTASDDLVLEPGVTVSGIREWLTSQRGAKGRAATFDTRIEGTTVMTEPASQRLADLFSDSQFELVAGPESFLVDDEARLRPGEEERARQWGHSLARAL
ncbi:MAG TPA: flavodoxin domain-containing protein [Glaciibacter sp.]|nr:flavodoxin domain-containing protein [Glaciibacter sp.]